ncbi:PLD nuclease N-terminal domain-containing protein [Rathayibacter soli]|uniref:PLD nuclease N-terminal domain-containing protein n=1 Tax=Rathayibacter soli TaxID=3144168 RepID=UPI0027E46D92|nr:PLD nuclease N-terminal domain-containing protein [Glaciibacter superstes]
MVRLAVPLAVAVALVYIYTIVDCALFDRARTRGLPKWAWIFVVILFPLIGSALWFLIGRGRRNAATNMRSVAPDDDPEFLRGLGKASVKNPKRSREQEERIRQMEKDLAELDETNKKNGESDQPGRRDA